MLILRNEDLDRARCRPQFVAAMLDDLRWFGFGWREGPDLGGPFAPYQQSERMSHYLAAFERLRDTGLIFPCTCSRQDVQRALSAPHESNDEPIYPGTCRPPTAERSAARRRGVNWRFRVGQDERISFCDQAFGPQSRVAGRDFGDFLVWRKDDLPSYQLAVVVDDAVMEITEVVRGVDLIASTFRQLLLYRALGLDAPLFYHCPLLFDRDGKRLAKRTGATTLRELRVAGITPAELRRNWNG